MIGIPSVIDVEIKLNENLNKESNEPCGHLHANKNSDNLESKASSHQLSAHQQINYFKVLQVKKHPRRRKRRKEMNGL